MGLSALPLPSLRPCPCPGWRAHLQRFTASHSQSWTPASQKMATRLASRASRSTSRARSPSVLSRLPPVASPLCVLAGLGSSAARAYEVCTVLDPQETEQGVHASRARPPSRADRSTCSFHLLFVAGKAAVRARLLLERRRPCCVANVRLRRQQSSYRCALRPLLLACTSLTGRLPSCCTDCRQIPAITPDQGLQSGCRRALRTQDGPRRVSPHASGFLAAMRQWLCCLPG